MRLWWILPRVFPRAYAHSFAHTFYRYTNFVIHTWWDEAWLSPIDSQKQRQCVSIKSIYEKYIFWLGKIHFLLMYLSSLFICVQIMRGGINRNGQIRDSLSRKLIFSKHLYIERGGHRGRDLHLKLILWKRKPKWWISMISSAHRRRDSD